MKKDKVKVGHEWDVPEGLNEYGRIGGYVIATDEDGVYVCGNTKFNLTECPILSSMMMPATKEYLDQGIELNDNNISNAFECEDIVYYLVTYGSEPKEGEEHKGSGTYIFDNFEEAINMLGFFVDYKAQSLQRQIDEKDK